MTEIKQYQLLVEKAKQKGMVYYPSYREVLSTLSGEGLHKCFVALEVFNLHSTAFTDCRAFMYLEDVAYSHNWDYDTFLDIIKEEYETLYVK